MAGKNLKLKRNARIKGKLVKAGKSVQVDKEIEADLLEQDAIEIDYEAEAIAKADAAEKAETKGDK